MSESRHQNKERIDEGYEADVSFINIVILGKYEGEKTNVFAVYPLGILTKIQQSEIRGKNKCEKIKKKTFHI